MAINMNQIDFEAIRERKDQVREDEQAHERKAQKSRQGAAKDIEKGRQSSEKALQESRNQAAFNLRDLVEQAANQRADKRDQSQMDRLALAAALQMVGEGGKLPEAFDYKNIGDLLHLAGAAGAAQRGERRVGDALSNFKLVDPDTGEPRTTEEIQRLVGDQLNAYRQASGEADPIMDLIKGALGNPQQPAAAGQAPGTAAPGAQPAEKATTPAAPTGQERQGAAPRSGHLSLSQRGRGQAPAPSQPAAAPTRVAASGDAQAAPAMSLADYTNRFAMPPMVDGQPTGAPQPSGMPPMVDGQPTGASGGGMNLAALMESLSRLAAGGGPRPAQATPATTPTGLPQLNPALPALQLPDVVDGRRI